MPEGIIVALIGLAGSGIGSLVGVLASSKLTQYRIEQLERQVAKHNNLIDRMYRVEEAQKVTDEKIRVDYSCEKFHHRLHYFLGGIRVLFYVARAVCMTGTRSSIEIGSYFSFIWFSCFLNGVHCIFYCFAAFQNREALPVIVNGERDLLSHKTFSYKIKHKQLCHFFYNQTCFIIIIRLFQHLPRR